MLRAGYTTADATLTSYLDCFRYDLTQAETAAGTAATWANTNYQNLRNAIAGGAQAVQNAFNTTLNSFNSKLDTLCSTLGNEAANLDGSISTAVSSIAAKAADTLSNAATVLASLNQALSNLPATVGIPDANGNIDPQAVADLQKAVLQFRDNQLAQAHQYVDKYLGVMRGSLGDITANTNQFLSLVRAFGDAPVANTLSFLPGKIGYYYQLAQNAAQVDLSPVTSILRQAGNIAQDAGGILDNALNVMHVQLPTQSLATGSPRPSGISPSFPSSSPIFFRNSPGSTFPGSSKTARSQRGWRKDPYLPRKRSANPFGVGAGEHRRARSGRSGVRYRRRFLSSWPRRIYHWTGFAWT